MDLTKQKMGRDMHMWYDEASFYHIYPLGLCQAPFENTGGETVHALPNLLPWLDHIKEMGCDALYIGPLFESETHGYDTIDYKQVDRRLGDNDDFVSFVQYAHQNGIRVVVDGVFNHTGRRHRAFTDIREKRENSAYRWWYKGVNFDWNSVYNDGFSYESWRNCQDLVCLNLQNEEVRQYLFDIARFWIHTFDIDGIRLDCADCLDFRFMEDLRGVVTHEKPDFWLMGEVIHGDYARWANERMLHSVTNYELHKGLYSGHNDHNYFEIAHTIRRQFDENGGIYRGRTLYSFVDNHDVSRIVDKLSDQAHLKSVYALLYTLPGLPSVYYGSEWGIHGRKEDGDRALRPGIDLAAISANPPVPGLYEWIRTLGRIRKGHAALRLGRYRQLMLTNRQYAFARICDAETVVILVNNDDQEAEFHVPLPWAPASLQELTGDETSEADGACLHARLQRGEAKIYLLESH